MQHHEVSPAEDRSRPGQHVRGEARSGGRRTAAVDGARPAAGAGSISRFSAPIRTRIRRRPPMADAPPGGETTSTTDPSLVTTGPAPAEPELGQTVRLPDIVLDGGDADIETDAIKGAIAYQGRAFQAGKEPENDFGDTKPGNYELTDIAITKGAEAYDVSANLKHDVTFQVRDEVGPGATRAKDITGPDDPKITPQNWRRVVADLTPNKSDYNGRPPRLGFWSRDITIVHERFHADEAVALSSAGTTQATNDLNQRQAASVEGVQQALEALVVDVKTARDDGMKMPGRENRAYGDGAHLYDALTTGIAKRFANTEKETRSGATKSDSKGGKEPPKRNLRNSQ
jgi:hypothetical protein